MGSLAPPHVTGLFPPLGATDGRTFSSGRCHRVVPTVTGRGRAHPGRVAAHVVAAGEPFLPEDAATANSSRHVQATNANQLSTTRKEDRVFEVEMQVQDDDLDPYGVVSNAIYASYIHRGQSYASSDLRENSSRDVLLEYLGIGVGYWAATGNALAISELNLKYFAPLRSGDRFIVKMWPEKIKGGDRFKVVSIF
ncbi:hypothetical protein EJB05_54116, partial [Eragrostis curvula]